MAAEKNDSILFFDEADSLISQRLESVTTGSEEEINNMRNAILTCLEEFTGIAIFASNFVKRYDFAFETRIQSILFPMPDVDMLEKIWRVHLPETIPFASSVDLHALAEKCVELKFCGRDVKNAVIRACKEAIFKGKDSLTMEDLINTSQYIFDSKNELHENEDVISSRNDGKDKVIKQSISEILTEDMEKTKSTFFNEIPCADDFDYDRFKRITVFLSDKEVKMVLLYACRIAQDAGREVLAIEDVVSALDSYHPRKDKEDAYELLLEAIQEMIDKENAKR